MITNGANESTKIDGRGGALKFVDLDPGRLGRLLPAVYYTGNAKKQDRHKKKLIRGARTGEGET